MIGIGGKAPEWTLMVKIEGWARWKSKTGSIKVMEKEEDHYFIALLFNESGVMKPGKR